MRFLSLYLTLLLPLLSIAQFDNEDGPKRILNGHFAVFKSNTGYLGIKNSDSVIVITPQYVNITEVDEGIIVVKPNKNTGFERSYSSGFLNKKLKTILPCNYRNIYSSGNGMLIACQNSDSKYGLVDTLGRIRIPFQYEDIGFYGDELFPVKQGNMYGYLNENGKVIIPFNFSFAHPFSEGKAGAKKNGLFGFIDKHGKFVIPEKFQEVGAFHYGFASTRINDFSTVIDEKGQLLFPPVFETIEAIADSYFIFSCSSSLRDTLAGLVKREEGKAKTNLQNIEMINADKFISDTLIPFEEETNLDFEGVISFQTGLVSPKELREVTFLMKRNGHLLFSVQSKIEVDKNDNWNFALMNEEGKILTPFDYFEIKVENEFIVGEKEEGSNNVRYQLDNSGKATKK